MSKDHKKKPKPSIPGGIKKKIKRTIDLDAFWYDERLFNALILGTPRSGKTVLLANMVNIHKGLGFNCFINDCAKGYDLKQKKAKAEILMYFSEALEFINKEIRIFTPLGCHVDIPTQKYESVQVRSYDELFEKMKPDKLNVISFDSFVLPPLAFARFWALFSIELLYRSKRAELYTPVLCVIDQINHVFPSSALRFSGIEGSMQNKASNWFARFCMDSSGSGIRILASTHGITMVKRPIRNAFQWKFFKQFNEDVSAIVSRIKPAQKIIESLAVNEAYATDDQSWGDKIPDIPNVPYESEPVSYMGEFIEDDFWMLDSRFRSRVLTPKEFKEEQRKKSGDTEGLFAKRLECGLLFLTGMTYDELVERLQVNESTVKHWLKWWRTVFPYGIIEDYRYNLELLTRKKIDKALREHSNVGGLIPSRADLRGPGFRCRWTVDGK